MASLHKLESAALCEEYARQIDDVFRISGKATDKILIAEEALLSNDRAHLSAMRDKHEWKTTCPQYMASTMDCSHGKKYDRATHRSQKGYSREQRQVRYSVFTIAIYSDHQ